MSASIVPSPSCWFGCFGKGGTLVWVQRNEQHSATLVVIVVRGTRRTTVAEWQHRADHPMRPSALAPATSSMVLASCVHTLDESIYDSPFDAHLRPFYDPTTKVHVLHESQSSGNDDDNECTRMTKRSDHPCHIVRPMRPGEATSTACLRWWQTVPQETLRSLLGAIRSGRERCGCYPLVISTSFPLNPSCFLSIVLQGFILPFPPTPVRCLSSSLTPFLAHPNLFFRPLTALHLSKHASQSRIPTL